MEDEYKGQGSGKEQRSKAAHRQGDLGGDVGSPSVAIGGSPNVFINGRHAMREGDAYEDGSILTAGSHSVFINGRPVGRIGDAINNDGTALTGSPNVFIGRGEAQAFSSSCAKAYRQARKQADEILAAEPPVIHPEDGVNTNRERNIINRYIRRNRLINEAYAKLYQDMPDNRWAGIAAIVSSQMGCNIGMVAHKYTNTILQTFAPYPTYVLFPGWIEALGEGNRAIFDAMYPALRTAAEQGYDQFLKCYEAGAFSKKEVPKAIADAIKKLQSGELREAADLLVNYEQKDVARPIYEKYANSFASLETVAEMSAIFDMDLKSLPLSRRCGSVKNIIPFTKDLTNENDRVNYFWDLYNHWDGVLD